MNSYRNLEGAVRSASPARSPVFAVKNSRNARVNEWYRLDKKTGCIRWFEVYCCRSVFTISEKMPVMKFNDLAEGARQRT